MWQRFTRRAKDVVFHAQEEAQKYGQDRVATEHLLLGMLRETCTGTEMLVRMGIPHDAVRSKIIEDLQVGKNARVSDTTLTPRAKRVIDLAYDHARQLNDNFIGTEHLLLGLVRESDGLAGRSLAKLGGDLAKALEALILLRAEKGPAGQIIAYEPAASRLARSANPEERSLIFLLGACIHEHLMLTLIAGGDRAAEIIRAQVADIGLLQWQLWNEILNYSKYGASAIYPELLAQAVELAQEESGGEGIKPQHLLLALLSEKWRDFEFAMILADAGLTLKRTRELVADSQS